MKKIRSSVIKCINSFQYPIKGLAYVIKYENNFMYHIIATLSILLLGLYLNFNFGEWIIIFLLIGIVYITEIINTAIEKIVDLVSPEYQKTAGIIKDLSSAAVLVAAATAFIIGVSIIYRNINI